MSLLALIKLSYFVAATLLLIGLQRMASPKTARSGIQWAGVGVLVGGRKGVALGVALNRTTGDGITLVGETIVISGASGRGGDRSALRPQAFLRIR